MKRSVITGNDQGIEWFGLSFGKPRLCYRKVGYISALINSRSQSLRRLAFREAIVGTVFCMSGTSYHQSASKDEVRRHPGDWEAALMSANCDKMVRR